MKALSVPQGRAWSISTRPGPGAVLGEEAYSSRHL